MILSNKLVTLALIVIVLLGLSVGGLLMTHLNNGNHNNMATSGANKGTNSAQIISSASSRSTSFLSPKSIPPLSKALTPSSSGVPVHIVFPGDVKKTLKYLYKKGYAIPNKFLVIYGDSEAVPTSLIKRTSRWKQQV
jgi:hypothetical protein